MNTHAAAWLLLLLSCVLMPAFADDAEHVEPLPEEDTILGQWYLQTMDGRVISVDEQARVIFENDGSLRSFERGEEQLGRYVEDKASARITIYEKDRPTRIEASIKYSFLDDMLILRILEKPGQRGAEEELVMALTRNPEGNKQHQALREKQGNKPTRKQRVQQMRELSKAAMMYHAQHNDPPSSIGDLVAGEFVTLESAVLGLGKDELPKDFTDWESQAKRDWVNRRTGCVYVMVDIGDPGIVDEVMLFEVPAEAKQEKVVMVFGDGRAEIRPYAQADKAIAKQTGHGLEAWMKTTSPGSGQMVLPEKKQAKPTAREDE